MTPLREYSAEALATFEHEQDNMRASLEFALNRDDVVVASDLMAGLWFYWLSTGRGAEAGGWTRRYMTSSRERVHPLERFHGDFGAAEILRFAGDPEAAAALTRELVATGRAHPHAVVHGIVIERSTAANLSGLAYQELDAGRLVEAQSLAEESFALRRDLGLPHGIAHALLTLAAVAFHARRFDRARDLYAEAATRYEAAHSRGDALGAQLSGAECEFQLGRLEETAALLRDAMPRLHEFSDVTMHVQALRVAARLAAGRGDAERCAALLGAADSRLEESGLTLFSPFEEELHRTCLRGARDELGDAPFTAAYEKGAEASDETAFALAMSTD
jgi:tetratricopeptide (TPR) repeat protein